MAAALKLVSSLVLCVLVIAPMTHALTCGQVTRKLAPCFSYLRTGGRAPPDSCCNGVRTLNKAAKSTPVRRKACYCLKKAATQIPNINPNVAAGLPRACAVNIPYKISTSIDCSKVKGSGRTGDRLSNMIVRS